MIFRIAFICLITIAFSGCGSKFDFSELNRSWIPIGTIDNTELNISEEIVFGIDGKYSAITLSNNDSLIVKILGEFKVDQSTNTILIKFTSIQEGQAIPESITDEPHTIKVIQLNSSALSLENPNGMILNYKNKQ